LCRVVGFRLGVQRVMPLALTLYSPDSKVLLAQAFADLLKASFILIDIFPQYLQQRFWTSEYFEVEILAESLKGELATIQRLGY
jgi:hypothetical protein